MSFIRKSLIIIVLCFPFSGYAANPRLNSDAVASHKIIAEFKVAKQGEPILLPIKFKGKEYSFMLETGCPLSVFDISLKHELGEVKGTARTQTGGRGTIDIQLFDTPEAFLGPLNLRDGGQVLCVDHQMFSLILGRKISGAVGLNFLKKYVIQIDFDKGKLLFIEPSDSPDPSWGEELTITYGPQGLAYIKGTVLGSTDVLFLIDTGMNYTGDLETKFFEGIIKNRETKVSKDTSQVAGETIQEMNFRTDDLSVGSLKYKGLILGASSHSRLGLGFLSRHTVTFDFPNNTVYLKKGRNFDKIDEADMSGLHLLRIPNGIFVHSVDKDSPAEKAGVRANDIILTVSNKDGNKYDMPELRRFLKSGEGQEITMTIKRGKEVRKVSFLLEKKI